jgi:hypothetical protein
VKLRDFVTQENIVLNVKGREHLAVWDTELTDDDVAKLSDQAYLDKLEEEHREIQAYHLAKYANAKYAPKDLAKRINVPEHHVWAFWALHGSRGTGLYS